MSPVGQVINEVLNGNIYSGRRGFGSLDKRVFEYFEKTPIEYLKDINTIAGYDVRITPLETFIEKFNKKVPNIVNNLKIPEEIQNSTIKARNQFIFERAFAKYITNPEISYQDKVNLINEISYTTTNQTNQEVFNQIKDFILDYTRQVDTVIRNIDTFNDIRTLSEGAAEMRTLGQLLGINQGIKTKADEFIKQVQIIERAIYDKTKDPKDIINLTQFVMDPEYRKEQIIKYEDVKHSFNILDIVSTVPHFLEYITNLAEANEELNSSFIFRSTKVMSLAISDRLKYNREDKITKGIANFLNDYLIKQWMSRTEAEQLKPIAIPKGNKIFDKNGVESELKEPTTIKLGTDEANATFRAWFENEVIPNLKRGEIRPGIHNEEVENNKFIKDIGNSVVNNTILRNPSIVESLPISMSPRSENERSVFDNYRSAFNEIGGLVYEWNTYTYEFDDDGGVKAIPESHKMSIVDLFTLYAMVANSWKSGERSIVPILVDFQRVGLIQDFHDFVGKVDKSEDVLTLEDIEFNDILPYVAPSESPYSSFAEYIKYRNKDTHKYQLMKRFDEKIYDDKMEDLRKTGMTEEEIEKQIKLDRKNRKGKFEFINISVDPNYFQTGRVQSSKGRAVNTQIDPEIVGFYGDDDLHHVTGFMEIQKINENEGVINTVKTGEIKFDLKTGKILSIDQRLSKIKQMPLIKINGRKRINISELVSDINNILNPC